MPLNLNKDNLLKYIIDAMDEMVCVLDTSLKAVYFNQNFGEMIKLVHGFIPQLNETIYDKTAEVYSKEWLPRLNNALLGKYFEEVISTKDNQEQTLHYKITVNPLLKDKLVEGIMIKVIDVTQEKNNEINLQAFKLLAANIPNIDVLVCDTDFTIAIAVCGEMKKQGIDANYLMGKNLIDISNQLNLEMLVPIYKSRRNGNSESIEYEYNKEYYWLETYPIFDNNKVKNIIIITRNITELKRKNIALQQLNITKDNILVNVAHDMRNPITAILGLSNLLMSSSQENDQYIDLITRSCNNVLSIINDILDATELDNDNFKLNLANIELNSFISDVIIDENHNAANKNITIHLDTNKEEIFVRIHHDKFKRVISNLISNAVKFSYNGTKINITTQYLNKRVLIKFKDHGIGIPPKLQEIIFDKFTKAGRFGTAGEKSFGLGLSIVKQIVKLHDGSVWLESEENKGTTVFIELNTII